jgi:hypothetical protein
MRAAVDDVHHGNRQGVGHDAAQIAVERHPVGFGRGPRRRHGDPQNGVGAQFALVGGAVQFDDAPIEGRLVGCVHAEHLRGDVVHDVGHRGPHPFAAVAFGALVAQLESLAGPGRGPRGDRSPPHGAAGKMHVHFDGRVSAGVEDLPGLDFDDFGHGFLPAPAARGSRRVKGLGRLTNQPQMVLSSPRQVKPGQRPHSELRVGRSP